VVLMLHMSYFEQRNPENAASFFENVCVVILRAARATERFVMNKSSLFSRAKAELSAYELGTHLGSGSHAKVFKGVAKATGQLVAIKVVDKTGHFRDKARAMEALKRESEIISKLDHPHIVKVRALVVCVTHYCSTRCLDSRVC
jgi:serine/threonine protein kinase